MTTDFLKTLPAIALCFGLASAGHAQNAPAAPTSGQQQAAAQPDPHAAPTPLPTPALTGPLQAAPPNMIGDESSVPIAVNGVVTGIGLLQGNHIPGDGAAQGALSNAQIFIQKATGWWQFYVQAGAYDLPALGAPFLATDKTISNLYGPVPVAYVKLAPGKNTSIMAGSLPTLMGAEYTFTFQNMNIERGLLWNQENAVNRGVQINQTIGKFTASLSWNDGFYSNRYSWLNGALTYSDGAHSVAFSAMGNLGQTAFQTVATPVQNNSSMYALVYTYTKGSWIVQPYFQYSGVPRNPQIHIVHGAATRGGALLLSRTFKDGFSLAWRGEYISSTGNAAEQAVNLLYGPGSAAWSLTLTPTYQHRRFLVRGDLALVRATSFTPGDAFGPSGVNQNQPRAAIEAGFLF